jgi:tetratricopeptide (TPR) repeat protein
LTTRITTFSHAETYPIKHLSISDAQQLFSRHYPGHDHAENDLLDTILNAVNYNTLVIELLAKNMNNFNTILKKRYPLKDMWNDITEGGLLSLSKSSDVTTDYKKMKAKPEEIIKAMYNISELSEEEKVLMSVFAVLPATNLPFAHIEELLPEIDSLDTLVLSIAQKGWVEFDQFNKCFKTSPVIQEIIRKQHSDKLFEHCEGIIERLIEKLDYHASIGALVHCTYDTGLTFILYAEMVCKHLHQARYIITGLNERIGNFHNTFGNLEKSLKYFDDYNRLTKELYDSDPNNVAFKNGLAISYINLGVFYQDSKTVKKNAQKYFQKAKDLWEDLVNKFPNYVEFQKNLKWVNKTLDNL